MEEGIEVDNDNDSRTDPMGSQEVIERVTPPIIG